MGKKMADISEQLVCEEVSEPQQKKCCVLTEKQKEALARGRAKKLELNLMHMKKSRNKRNNNAHLHLLFPLHPKRTVSKRVKRMKNLNLKR